MKYNLWVERALDTKDKIAQWSRRHNIQKWKNIMMLTKFAEQSVEI